MAEVVWGLFESPEKFYAAFSDRDLAENTKLYLDHLFNDGTKYIVSSFPIYTTLSTEVEEFLEITKQNKLITMQIRELEREILHKQDQIKYLQEQVKKGKQ